RFAGQFSAHSGSSTLSVGRLPGSARLLAARGAAAGAIAPDPLSCRNGFSAPWPNGRREGANREASCVLMLLAPSVATHGNGRRHRNFPRGLDKIEMTGHIVLMKPSHRDLLLDTGLRVLHERGFNATSVQDITEAAGVPKGSFYNHFESKEDL